MRKMLLNLWCHCMWCLYAAGVPGRAPWQRQELSQTAKHSINPTSCVSGMERQQAPLHLGMTETRHWTELTCLCIPLLGWLYPTSILPEVWGQRIWYGIPDTIMLSKRKITYLMLFFFCLYKKPGEGSIRYSTKAKRVSPSCNPWVSIRVQRELKICDS